MIHSIENDYLKISVDDHGAELCSIYDKIHNREVLWQADPAYWNRHAQFFSQMWDVFIKTTTALTTGNILQSSMDLPETANSPAWI